MKLLRLFMASVKYVKGQCKTMCPADEFEMYSIEMFAYSTCMLNKLFPIFRRRERNLVRHFEKSFLTAIKCYSRSAAGQSAAGPKGVRDLATLESTTQYLMVK